MIEIDPAGRVHRWSAGAERLLGYSAREALGTPLADLVGTGPDGSGSAMRTLADFLAAHAWPPPMGTLRCPLRRGNGLPLVAELSVSAVGRGEARRARLAVRALSGSGILEASLGASLEREQEALRAAVGAVGRVLEARDPYTAGHQQRVARLAHAIAMDMGLGTARAEGVFLGAALHDIGKVNVPAEILVKPTHLHRAEWTILHQHATVGYHILKDLKSPWPVADIAHQHHECLDGSGYPLALKGDAIRLEARIVTVADVVESVCSHRPYRPASSLAEGLELIHRHRGEFFDPDVVASCTRIMEGGYALAA